MAIPPFRGIARFFDIFLALGVSGIIAAALLALLGKLATNSFLAIPIGLASPVIFGFLPMLLSFTGVSGLMTQGGFFPFRRGSAGSQSNQQKSSSVGGVVAGVAITQTVGQTKLRSPRQINTNVSNPPSAPLPIIERLRNRRTITATSNPRDNVKFADQLKGMKMEADYVNVVPQEKLKQYGKEMEWIANTAPPIPGIHEEIKSTVKIGQGSWGLLRNKEEG